MTPSQIVQFAWAIDSLYPGEPALDASVWDLLDQISIPADSLPTSLILRHRETGKMAKPVRGSQTGYDWRKDFTFVMRASPFGTGMVEAGFHDYWAPQVTASGDPIPDCDWYGGHSLGGPCATYDAAKAPIGKAELVLYATPEPGDALFSGWISPRLLSVTRLENPEDAVPDAPGRFLGYQDVAGPTTPINMVPLGPPAFDILKPFAVLEFNHHLPNYVKAYQLQYMSAV